MSLKRNSRRDNFQGGDRIQGRKERDYENLRRTIAAFMDYVPADQETATNVKAIAE